MANQIKRLSMLALFAALSFGAAACEDDDDDDDRIDGGNGNGNMDAGADGGGEGGTDAGEGGTGDGALGPMGRPTLGNQIDRMGRPAISTALIATFNANEAQRGMTKDAYNQASNPGMWASMFAPDIAESLGILDALDGTCGTQLLVGTGADRYAALAAALANDQLFVNTASGTCGTYLGVEAEAIGAVTMGMGGCGGRTPLDDVIARSYSVLAAGALSGVDDTITEDDATHNPDRFPFLAAPQDEKD